MEADFSEDESCTLLAQLIDQGVVSMIDISDQAGSRKILVSFTPASSSSAADGSIQIINKATGAVIVS